MIGDSLSLERQSAGITICVRMNGYKTAVYKRDNRWLIMVVQNTSGFTPESSYYKLISITFSQVQPTCIYNNSTYKNNKQRIKY